MRTGLAVLGAATVLVAGVDAVAWAATGRGLVVGGTTTVRGTTTIKNTGPGPALRLKSRRSAPSLKVSSNRLVPRLNADRVDGRHAQELEPVTRRIVLAEGGESFVDEKWMRATLPAGTYQLTGTGGMVVESANSWTCVVGDRAGIERGDLSQLVGLDIDDQGAVQISGVVDLSGRELLMGCVTDGATEVIMPVTFSFQRLTEATTTRGVSAPSPIGRDLRLGAGLRPQGSAVWSQTLAGA
ncbi:hypothetical protein [Nocardioides sp. SYSU D00038]|uniref:hypothetical protein n=1 Tax=Nocardioides sp. SYSU D00038 TaxID=2812554 RepID=UPI001967EB11|nr:hypothetical protein [Nocardioides sp. SYSU D00038]